MTKRINLGGMYGELTVEKHTTYYMFRNMDYGMKMVVYLDDINDVIANPYKKRWNSNSYSNDVYDKDKDLIIKFLMRTRCKYKTVSEVVKSRSKYKEKYLKQFGVRELLDYYKERKEKANVKT